MIYLTLSYKKALIAFIIALAPAAFCPSSHADAGERDLIEELSAAISRYFALVPERFAFEATNKLTKFDAEGNPVSEYPSKDYSRQGRFSYLQEGQKYRIMDDTSTGYGAAARRSLITYDGSSYQRLRFGDDELYIDSKVSFDKRPSEYFLRWSNPLLLPWEFLSHGLTIDDLADFGIWELKSPKVIQSLVARIKGANVHKDEHGETLVVAEISAGKEGITKQESTYRVYFAPQKHMFPVAWERISTDGKLLFRYEVTQMGKQELENGDFLLYPVVADREVFGGNSKATSKDAPAWSMRYTIGAFNIRPEVDALTFQIDPASAGRILDAQNKTVIDIPR